MFKNILNFIQKKTDFFIILLRCKVSLVLILLNQSINVPEIENNTFWVFFLDEYFWKFSNQMTVKIPVSQPFCELSPWIH